jgi:penicillin-binding protein 1A
VRALVGGRNYALAPFNRATLSMRHPGSSFKPFVYAKALEDSLSAATIVPDTALAIRLDNGRVYSPDNSTGRSSARSHARGAHSLAQSGRRAARARVRTRLDVGDRASRRDRIAVAEVRRVRSARPVVRPLDYVAAYSVWANLGSTVEPRLVTHVDGRDRQDGVPARRVVAAVGDRSAHRVSSCAT